MLYSMYTLDFHITVVLRTLDLYMTVVIHTLDIHIEGNNFTLQYVELCWSIFMFLHCNTFNLLVEGKP